MKNLSHALPRTGITVAFCVIALLGACRHTTISSTTRPVAWFPGFTLGRLLDSPHKLTSQAAIAKALHEPWYFHGKLAIHEPSAPPQPLEHPVHACAGYLSLERHVGPVAPSAHAAFLSLAMMCQAGQWITTARPSRRSHLRGLLFDADLPDKLPAMLAMAISTDHLEQVQRMAARHASWREAAGIDSYQPCRTPSPWCGIYRDASGGIQKVQLLARGDIDGDGVEDMLIRSLDSVVGGSYVNVRLFALTRRHAGGDIRLLRTF